MSYLTKTLFYTSHTEINQNRYPTLPYNTKTFLYAISTQNLYNSLPDLTLPRLFAASLFFSLPSLDNFLHRVYPSQTFTSRYPSLPLRNHTLLHQDDSLRYNSKTQSSLCNFSKIITMRNCTKPLLIILPTPLYTEQCRTRPLLLYIKPTLLITEQDLYFYTLNQTTHN